MGRIPLHSARRAVAKNAKRRSIAQNPRNTHLSASTIWIETSEPSKLDRQIGALRAERVDAIFREKVIRSIESTVRYLVIKIDDAIEIAEKIEI